MVPQAIAERRRMVAVIRRGGRRQLLGGAERQPAHGAVGRLAVRHPVGRTRRVFDKVCQSDTIRIRNRALGRRNMRSPFEYSTTDATEDSVLISTSPYLRGIRSCWSYGCCDAAPVLLPLGLLLLLVLPPPVLASFAADAAAVPVAAVVFDWLANSLASATREEHTLKPSCILYISTYSKPTRQRIRIGEQNLLAAAAHADRLQPAASGHRALVQRARRAEAEAAAATVVLLQRGVRLEAEPALVARPDVGVQLPVRRIDAIGHPAGQQLRRLRAQAAHRIADVVDVIEHLLRRIDRAVRRQRVRRPHVSDLAAERAKWRMA